jgi:adenine phosphoribosyltransferase
MNVDDIKKIIRDIPDFPKEGILFKDITTLLKDAQALHATVDHLISLVADKDFDLIIGIESRGFIFGSAMAYAMNKAFAPVRKKGKLPAETSSVTYELEYGNDTLEIHTDAIVAGTRVLIVDDLLATGGTAAAVVELVEKLNGSIASFVFLIELDFLSGRQKIKQHEVFSLLHF